MEGLILVSNRLPVTIERKKTGTSYRGSVGGLATGLSGFYQSFDSKWIGWSGIPADNLPKKEIEQIGEDLRKQFSCYPVSLSRREIQNFYSGFCNETLWPLFNYFPQYVKYDNAFWDTYRRVNRLFAEQVTAVARPNDIIWVHDYQLMLLPRLIREKIPDAVIGYFLHTPFPTFELFRLLPWRNELLEGLLGADLIGFHTFDYARHFLSSIHRLLGYDYTLGKVMVGDRVVKTDAFPIGIDFERYHDGAGSPEAKREIESWGRRLTGKKLIVSVDRMDYAKGITQRIEAFAAFLRKHPSFRGKVVYVLLTVPSRENIRNYRLLKSQVDELVGSTNSEFGTLEWTPIRYMHRYLPMHQITALYNLADVAMVTSVRDGMNLVAKEYIASKRDRPGALILSETAGAAKELVEAIIVNPNSRDDMVSALRQALTMSRKEQLERMAPMQRRVRRFDIRRWAEEFIERLRVTKKIQQKMQARLLSPKLRRELLDSCASAEKRLLLLDYDGTLVGFRKTPQAAKPGKQVLELLERLSRVSGNEVVLISGRDRKTIQKWFGGLDIGLSAEHGAWIKSRGGDWQMIEPLSNDWKPEVLSMLELFVDRTPGSMVEEKTFSLVWHYRRVETELGLIRVRELLDDLEHIASLLNLQVLEGHKVVEVKNTNINKGRAARRWLEMADWDFILAMGDDWTDEDIFGVLPAEAFSIRIGLTPSQARTNLENPKDVLTLLEEILARVETTK